MKKFRSLPRIVRAFLCIVVFIILPSAVFILGIDDLLTGDPYDGIVIPLVATIFCLLSFQVYVSTDEELFKKHSLLRFNVTDRLIIVGTELVAYVAALWLLAQDFYPGWLRYFLIVPLGLGLYVIYTVLLYFLGSEELKKDKREGSFLFRREADRFTHDAVIKPPLFLCESHGVQTYGSLEDAARNFKPKLVTGAEILYDSEGRSLRVEVHDNRIVFKANEAYYPNHGDELRQALQTFLGNRGASDGAFADASLQELVDKMTQYGI